MLSGEKCVLGVLRLSVVLRLDREQYAICCCGNGEAAAAVYLLAGPGEAVRVDAARVRRGGAGDSVCGGRGGGVDPTGGGCGGEGGGVHRRVHGGHEDRQENCGMLTGAPRSSTRRVPMDSSGNRRQMPSCCV